ncbi:MAG: DUF4157 domain-containing protein [Candidatus Methanoperedens sp.]|nr:DUF4157 domain-containing protein [Candidatus Methanoperedens sp.]
MNERISITDKKPEVKSQNHVPQIRRKTESYQSMNSPINRILFLQRTIGNQAVQRLMKSGALQAKLKIGQPGDVYEKEADRVAEQVMQMPDVSEAKDTRIQRKCPKCLRGLLGKDKNDEKLQAKEIRGETPEVTSNMETNINALRGGGQPLTESARAFFEPRFGTDFSRVQVHSGGAAEQSARNLNAHAYTVGHDMVFGGGQFAPGTQEGRRLIAHELTHVVQQSGSDGIRVGQNNEKHGLSPITNETILIPATARSPSLAVQRSVGDPAQRPPGLSCRTATNLPPFPAVMDILFPTGGGILTTAQKGQISAFVASWRALGGNTPVRVDGFASTDDSEQVNWELSCRRAQNVVTELTAPSSGSVPGIPSGSITFVAQGETDEFSQSDPAPNRRVTIDTPAPLPPTPVPPEPEPPVPPRPTTNGICGPDVASQVLAAIAKTRSTFGGWSNSDKRSACDALDSLITGGAAWDIVELHNQGWILGYRPSCATQGATPPCGSTVKIGSDCYYAGSPNYVIFGVMCQLCNSHFSSIGDTSAANRFSQSKMEYWINFYKGTGPFGGSTPSGNFGPSQEWAIAGYNLWPASSTPIGDRNNCAPNCPTSYAGAAFTVHWIPHGVF